MKARRLRESGKGKMEKFFRTPGSTLKNKSSPEGKEN
jgi:hypothetical protein